METMTKQPNSLNSFLLNYNDPNQIHQYCSLYPAFKVSAGVGYASKMCELKWLIIRIFIYQRFREFRIHPYQIWEMHRVNEDHLLVISSNEKGIIQIDRQHDTHFKFDYFKMVMVENVLFLPSEILNYEVLKIRL